MCEWGDTVPVRVNIPAHLSHTGKNRWEEKAIDRCIAPFVKALNKVGILTASSCCGHGERDGEIILQDGRVLKIENCAGSAASKKPDRFGECSDQNSGTNLDRMSGQHCSVCDKEMHLLHCEVCSTCGAPTCDDCLETDEHCREVCPGCNSESRDA